MGMSASQARLIQLEARQSNLEYQGQQINQERTILSQQCTDLYNSLLTMQVPTPPSTQDYTTVQYAGVDGASSFTIGNIVPTGDTYSVEMNYKKTGHYLEDKNGSVQVRAIPEYITVSPIEIEPITEFSTYAAGDQPTGETAPANGTPIMRKQDNGSYVLKNGKFTPATDEEKKDTKIDKYTLTTVNNDYNKETDTVLKTGADGKAEETKDYSGGLTKSELTNHNYMIRKGDTLTRLTADDLENTEYFTSQKTSSGTMVYQPKEGITIVKQDKASTSSQGGLKNPDYDNYAAYAGDAPCMTLKQANDCNLISDSSYANYLDAIKNSNPDAKEEDYLVYFSEENGLQVPHFVLKTDATSGMDNEDHKGWAAVSDYAANGSYTSSVTKPKCQLTFDTSGRIIAITVPTAYDADGEATSYKTIDLEASTTTDELAYKDAYNKYEYAMYEYDKKQQEINAKTEIIQQEDRNLELKLQRLDNERQQITTEIEAVQKVIDDNIEASYKTFSG